MYPLIYYQSILKCVVYHGFVTRLDNYAIE